MDLILNGLKCLQQYKTAKVFKIFGSTIFFKTFFQIIESKKPQHAHTLIILRSSSALLLEISQYLLILWFHISVMMGLCWFSLFICKLFMLRILAGLKKQKPRITNTRMLVLYLKNPVVWSCSHQS